MNRFPSTVILGIYKATSTVQILVRGTLFISGSFTIRNAGNFLALQVLYHLFSFYFLVSVGLRNMMNI